MAALSIFNIQRFSTHDGTGIRTNVFFKGCPLRCTWCSNPESQLKHPELIYNKRLCKNFLDCEHIAQGSIHRSEDGLTIDRANIRDYNKFRNICPARALVVAGEEKSVDEIIFEIEKDSLFYLNDQGGVTFTGGEPFFQDDLLVELAKEIKIRGIHLAVETCLHVPWKKLEKFVGIVDNFLVDIKHTDPYKFKKFTGGELYRVNDNLDRLDRNNCQITGRIPVIPSFNFSDNELKSIVDHILKFRNIHEINFIAYHLLGREKYYMLDREYHLNDFSIISPDDLKPYAQYAKERGLTADIGG